MHKMVTEKRQTLIDQYKQTSISDIENSPRCICYKLLKDELNFENYLNVLDHREF